jgi:antitoxin component of MazEF toxin-antitoxin module
MQTIPKKFVANIREQISEQVTLEVPNGKTYTVEVAEEQHELVLRFGWAEFASAYELELADLLVFENTRNSHLKVRIFDRSGCEKEPSCVLLDRVPCMQERKGSHGKQMQSPTGKRLAVGRQSGSIRKTPKMNSADSPSTQKKSKNLVCLMYIQFQPLLHSFVY